MNLRVIGLGAVVLAAALLSPAASAGPAGAPAAPAGPAGAGGAPGKAPGEAPGEVSGEAPAEAPALLAGIDAPPAAGRATCGPEVASPDGVEAQTCVLTEGRDTWARTYYRNATGEELGAVLTLMAPGGRTVQAHCEVRAEDEPGVCETPAEPSRGTSAEYTAVAEFAESGESPLLLRSGSNSAP
ncbi:hypothetical protein ACPCSC_26485 [Streptomyces lavendulocolor]|uniref:hypothetical protein n=1 Tax=Streptomyces lavendulocolor TaxID=67316 RepID=UPI003C3044AC